MKKLQESEKELQKKLTLSELKIDELEKNITLLEGEKEKKK